MDFWQCLASLKCTVIFEMLPQTFNVGIARELKEFVVFSKTRPSKLCGFCIFHTKTCEPLIEKWFVCYAFFNVSENGKMGRNGEKRGETMREKL